MSCGLIVADAEVLDLAVAQVAASHDVELARDPVRDVLCVQLGLARVDLLEPSVDGVPGEVTHEVAVATERAPHVVVQLAVDTEVERLARPRLADGERPARLEPFLRQHGWREPDVRQTGDDSRGSVEVWGARDWRHYGSRNVLQNSSLRVRCRVLGELTATDNAAERLSSRRSRKRCGLRRGPLQLVDLGAKLGGGHALSLAEDVVHLSLGKLSEGDGPVIPQTLILSTADPRA